MKSGGYENGKRRQEKEREGEERRLTKRRVVYKHRCACRARTYLVKKEYGGLLDEGSGDGDSLQCSQRSKGVMSE